MWCLRYMVTCVGWLLLSDAHGWYDLLSYRFDLILSLLFGTIYVTLRLVEMHTKTNNTNDPMTEAHMKSLEHQVLRNTHKE